MNYYLLSICFFLSVFGSCADKPEKKETAAEHYVTESLTDSTGKPPTFYTDTLTIDFPAAVFYYPDSIQLKKIERVMGKGVFDATMHEYDSQFRVSHAALKKEWPSVRIIEARSARYLRFIKMDKEEVLVDLNTKGDPYGLVIFNRVKNPQPVDMMNADTQLYYYFSQ